MNFNLLAFAVTLILAFIIIYVLLLKLYGVLFRITGMTREKSKFQVISLLTSTGFTTSESEIITDDRTRRNIAKAAMLTGYTFSVIIVSLIITIITNLSGEAISNAFTIISVAFGVFIAIIILLKLPFISRPIENLVGKIATKFLSRGKNDNIITTLDNYGKNAICEVYIKRLPRIMEHKDIVEVGLKDKFNINLLILTRGERMLDISRNTVLQNKDKIVVFGNYQNIKDLFSNRIRIEFLDEDNKSKENEVEVIDNYGLDAMVKVKIKNLPKFMKNKTMADNLLKSEFALNVLTLKRDDVQLNITKDTVIEEGDEITLFGPYNYIKNIFVFMTDYSFEDDII